jgi:hypothetical protein
MVSQKFKKSLDTYISRKRGTYVSYHFRLKQFFVEIGKRLRWFRVKIYRIFRDRFSHLWSDLDLSKIGSDIFVIPKKKKTVRAQIRIDPDEVEKTIQQNSIK